jgi:phosphatidyl-myo-inositol alpha-mannosyltransferase
MRIALTNPFCWPHVRRGSERFIEELAAFLTGRGHEVTRIVGAAGRGVEEQTGKGRRIQHRLLWNPAMRRLRLNAAHGFVPGACQSLWSLEADVVHSLYYLDAWLANRTRRRRSRRTLFHLVGPPDPRGFRRIPPDRQMLRQAIKESDQLLAISRFVADVTETVYGRRPKVLPIPTDLRTFNRGGGKRTSRPVILSVASFDEARKGARVLVGAFVRLKQWLPDAELRMSGSISDERRQELLRDVPDSALRDIRILGAGELSDLPEQYRQASLMVLPSVKEGFGMVVIESWACGTPVVVSNDGALPELVTRPGVGVLFDPREESGEATNEVGLAEAMREGLELAKKPETAECCERAAQEYSWERVGPRYEELYKTLME